MINRYLTPEMKDLFQEEKRFEFMLFVEKSVALVQAELDMIPQKAAQDIVRKGRVQLSRILEIEKTTKHDVIAFVSQVAETVGSHGKYVHFGLTSSDVLDTALSLQLRQGLDLILKEVTSLKKILKKLVLQHAENLCPGRTHGIYAEITTFGFKLAGFLSEIQRCEIKIKEAQKTISVCKLSGAVGTSSTLSVEFEKKVAQILKLKVEPFATQVIPRDRHATVMMSLAFVASALERLAIELRHLQRSEVAEVIEGFSVGQKGSSAMPHKKNPISAENITGLARLIKGYAWTAMENIPLWHERDISHSSNERIIFQDSFSATHYILRRMTDLCSQMYVDDQRMLSNTFELGGVLYSSHVLLYLVENQKMSREEAYSLIQKAAHNLKPGESLQQVLLKNSDTKKYFNAKDLDQIFSGQRHKKAIKKRLGTYLGQIDKNDF